MCIELSQCFKMLQGIVSGDTGWTNISAEQPSSKGFRWSAVKMLNWLKICTRYFLPSLSTERVLKQFEVNFQLTNNLVLSLRKTVTNFLLQNFYDRNWVLYLAKDLFHFETKKNQFLNRKLLMAFPQTRDITSSRLWQCNTGLLHTHSYRKCSWRTRAR